MIKPDTAPYQLDKTDTNKTPGISRAGFETLAGLASSRGLYSRPEGIIVLIIVVANDEHGGIIAWASLYTETMSTTLITALLAIVQIADIVIHAATGQLEPVRVAANVIVLALLAARSFGKPRQAWTLAAGAGYLALNLLFVAQHGITNAAQDGQLRVTLVVLVLATVSLLAMLLRKE